MLRRRAVTLGLGLVAVTAVVPSHFLMERGGGDQEGLVLVLDHLYAVSVAGLLLLLCAAVGRRLMTAAGYTAFPASSPACAVAVGSGVLSTALLVVGLAGLLHPWLVFLLLLTAGALTWKEGYETLRRLRRALARLLPGGGAEATDRAAFAGFGLLLAAMLVLALAPETDWDSLTYHLSGPRSFLEHGSIHLQTDNLHIGFVGLAHLLYVPLLALGSPPATAVLDVGFAALLGLAVWEFCRRHLDGRVPNLSLVLIWGWPILVLVAVTARIDVILALFLFLAHAAVIEACAVATDRKALGADDGVEDARILARFVLAGILLGFAFGIKLSSAAYTIALVSLPLWLVARGRIHPRSATTWAVALALGATAAVPWLVEKWVLLGDPVYPLLAGDSIEPWLTALPGTTDTLAATNSRISDWIWQVREPFNLPDFFFSPGDLTVEEEAALYLASPVIVVLPAWILRRRERILGWLLAPALLYVALVLIPFPRTNLRYLIPALVPLTIVSSTLWLSLLGRLFRGRRLAVAVSIVVLVCLAPTGRALGQRFTRTAALDHALGLVSRSDYLLEHGTFMVRSHEHMRRRVNDELPSDARLLMLWEARVGGFEPTVIQDTRGTNWPLLATKVSEDSCLGSIPVTHVLLNVVGLDYWLSRGLDPDLAAVPELQSFSRRCLELLYEGNGYLLFNRREEST